jgi:general secretion pathway protein G
MSNLQRNGRGFTLLEILVVVAIIGILASIALPRFMDSQDNALKTATLANIKSMETALQMYKVDNFNYPSTEQGLAALRAKPSGDPAANNWKGPYLDSEPKDAWGFPLQYLRPGQHGDFDVYSLGADGKPGGEKADADIGNWDEK